jgi:ATP-dependent Clp protease ATP-binding subunit ClpA
MMKKIVLKYVKEVQEERLDKLNIELKLTDVVVNSIAKEGLDKQLGARPVKDLIEYKIIDQLTDLVLFGNLKNLKTKKTVTIEKDGDNFIIK